MDALNEFKRATDRDLGIHKIHTVENLSEPTFRLFCNLRRNFASKEDYKKLLLMVTRKPL